MKLELTPEIIAILEDRERRGREEPRRRYTSGEVLIEIANYKRKSKEADQQQEQQQQDQ